MKAGSSVMGIKLEPSIPEKKETSKYYEIVFEKSHYATGVGLRELVRKNPGRPEFSFEEVGDGKYKLSNEMLEALQKDSTLNSALKSAVRQNGKNVVAFKKSTDGGSLGLYEIAEASRGKEGDFNIHYVGKFGKEHGKESYVVSEEMLKILKNTSPVGFKIVGKQEDNSALIHSSF